MDPFDVKRKKVISLIAYKPHCELFLATLLVLFFSPSHTHCSTVIMTWNVYAFFISLIPMYNGNENIVYYDKKSQ